MDETRKCYGDVEGCNYRVLTTRLKMKWEEGWALVVYRIRIWIYEYKRTVRKSGTRVLPRWTGGAYIFIWTGDDNLRLLFLERECAPVFKWNSSRRRHSFNRCCLGRNPRMFHTVKKKGASVRWIYSTQRNFRLDKLAFYFSCAANWQPATRDKGSFPIVSLCLFMYKSGRG